MAITTSNSSRVNPRAGRRFLITRASQVISAGERERTAGSVPSPIDAVQGVRHFPRVTPYSEGDPVSNTAHSCMLAPALLQTADEVVKSHRSHVPFAPHGPPWQPAPTRMLGMAKSTGVDVPEDFAPRACVTKPEAHQL